MPIRIREARTSQQDRDWIEQAYGDYLADLSAGHTGVFPSLTVTGHSSAELVRGWFQDEGSVAFVILREELRAGFAVVQRESAAGDRIRHYRLSEFFVRQPYRRLGVGRAAALLLFGRFAGAWTIAEQTRNAVAVRFWRRIVSDYTRGEFRERQAHGEITQQFSNAREAQASPR